MSRSGSVPCWHTGLAAAVWGRRCLRFLLTQRRCLCAQRALPAPERWPRCAATTIFNKKHLEHGSVAMVAERQAGFDLWKDRGDETFGFRVQDVMHKATKFEKLPGADLVLCATKTKLPASSIL